MMVALNAPDLNRRSAVTVSRLVNRNVVAGRGRTSMRLEPELWEALQEICGREGQDMSALVRKVEETGHAGGRTSAVRVFVLSYFRDAATEAGHLASGHGTLSPSRQSDPVGRRSDPANQARIMPQPVA
jgi:predicted DNA-binding ribbon-helix-helix protein